jgi:hypothetical protein
MHAEVVRPADANPREVERRSSWLTGPPKMRKIASLLTQLRLPSKGFHLTETPRIVAAARPAAAAAALGIVKVVTGTGNRRRVIG